MEAALAAQDRLGQALEGGPDGEDEMVAKARTIINLLRSVGDRMTIFETDIRPYLLAVLEWTFPIVCWGSVGPLAKRLAACSAALIVARLLEMEREPLAGGMES